MTITNAINISESDISHIFSSSRLIGIEANTKPVNIADQQAKLDSLSTPLQ